MQKSVGSSELLKLCDLDHSCFHQDRGPNFVFLTFFDLLKVCLFKIHKSQTLFHVGATHEAFLGADQRSWS